jgi:predicted  nucleic acid-binding Zn-ribbon protein
VSTGGDALRVGTYIAKESEAAVQRKIKNSSRKVGKKQEHGDDEKTRKTRQERKFDTLSGF